MADQQRYQPSRSDDPRFKSLAYGDSFEFLNTQERRIVFDRVGPAEAETHLRTVAPRPEHAQAKANVTAKYGTNCPRCGKLLHMYHFHISSDGFAGIIHAYWICSDPQCGLRKKFYFEGYDEY